MLEAVSGTARGLAPISAADLEAQTAALQAESQRIGDQAREQTDLIRRQIEEMLTRV